MGGGISHLSLDLILLILTSVLQLGVAQWCNFAYDLAQKSSLPIDQGDRVIEGNVSGSQEW